MQYLFLIYEDPAVAPAPGTPERADMFAAYGTFTAEVAEAGKLRAGEPVHGPDTATTVRVRDGAPLHVDGPFAETKESLGGFYVLDCADLDEALAFAARIPSARYGSIEVRPIADMSAP